MKRQSTTEDEYSQLAHTPDAAEEASQSPASPDYPPESLRDKAAPEKKNKAYLTREKLLTVKADKLRRQIAPIKKWASLFVGHPYLLKRVVSIEIQNKVQGASSSTSNDDCKETAHYAELETETVPLMNVWITPIMVAEAENFDLASGDVYIIPLGKPISKDNGKEYHSFVIVRADELEYN